MARGQAKQSKQSSTRLAQANKQHSYGQECEGVKPNVIKNLNACHAAPDIASCCERLCRCAAARDQHAIVAFARGTRSLLLTGRMPDEDSGHAHMRSAARQSCKQCREQAAAWQAARPRPPRPQRAQASTKTPRAPKPAAAASSAKNSFGLLQTPFSATTASPGGSEQPTIARGLQELGLSGSRRRSREAADLDGAEPAKTSRRLSFDSF